MNVNQLLGAWSLAEFANYASDGSKRIWSGTLSGCLIYAAPNVVSVAINRSEVGEDGVWIEHHSFYCGEFKLIAADTVEHRVLQSSVVSRVGEIYRRTIKRKGNCLELRGIGLTGDVGLIFCRV